TTSHSALGSSSYSKAQGSTTTTIGNVFPFKIWRGLRWSINAALDPTILSTGQLGHLPALGGGHRVAFDVSGRWGEATRGDSSEEVGDALPVEFGIDLAAAVMLCL